jgi:hypothetical protein
MDHSQRKVAKRAPVSFSVYVCSHVRTPEPMNGMAYVCMFIWYCTEFVKENMEPSAQ